MACSKIDCQQVTDYLAQHGDSMADEVIEAVVCECKHLLAEGGVHNPDFDGDSDPRDLSPDIGGRSTYAPERIIAVAIQNVCAKAAADDRHPTLPRNDGMDPENLQGYQGPAQSLRGNDILRTATTDARRLESRRRGRHRP